MEVFDQGAKPDLADTVLEAIATNQPLPSFTAQPSFKRVCAPFVSSNVKKILTNDLSDLSAEVKAALGGCCAVKEDSGFWNHKAFGDLLRELADGTADNFVDVVEDACELSPVSLFTPPSRTPYAAVAACDIQRGFPFAQYTGKLIEGASDISTENCYLFEITQRQMEKRGYTRSEMLFIDPEKAGGPARFINDKWTPRGLPLRKQNCYVQFIFDNVTKQPMIFWFAERDIKKGEELIGDYGQSYWRTVFKVLMNNLAEDTLQMRHKVSHYEALLQR